ncbi:MAG: nitroreductase family protein [Candidatus Caenarcaniphilales bacterium]|jgi:nitroreductase|nr:nitroreductase family protein [Candidatus Caenarcaniphilales bacterium]
MQTLETVKARRSIKHYDPDHKMSEKEISDLISAAILSPTSFNIQNWRFVVVTDKALREDMKAAAWGQAQVTDASIVILLCADLKAWAKEPSRYWRNAPQQAQDTMVPMIGKFYENNDQLQRDEAMRSVGMAAQTIMLAAKAMEYDTCPMIGFDPAQVAQLINLPQDHVIGMMITVGKATKPARDRAGQLDLSEVLIRDRF